MKTKKLSFLLLVVIVFPLSAQRTLSVSVKPGAEINPDMYGVFFRRYQLWSRRRIVCRVGEKPFFRV